MMESREHTMRTNYRRKDQELNLYIFEKKVIFIKGSHRNANLHKLQISEKRDSKILLTIEIIIVLKWNIAHISRLRDLRKR